MRTRIVTRKLTASEAKVFSEEIRMVPGIVGYRPDELLKLPNLLVLESDGRPEGILAYTDSIHFAELKLLMVRHISQGNGYSRQLFDSFIERFAGSSKPIYAVTKNPKVMHLLQGEGFKRVRYVFLPFRCKLHQLHTIFSLYRAGEYIRKRRVFPGSGSYQYWVKLPSK